MVVVEVVLVEEVVLAVLVVVVVVVVLVGLGLVVVVQGTTAPQSIHVAMSQGICNQSRLLIILHIRQWLLMTT